MPSEPRIPTEPTLEELSAYLDHELDAATHARIADHLAICADCTRRLDGLRETVHAVRALPMETPPRTFTIPERRRPAFRWAPVGWLGGAAAALLIVVAGVTQLHGPAASPTAANKGAAQYAAAPNGQVAPLQQANDAAASIAQRGSVNSKTVVDPQNSSRSLTISTDAGSYPASGVMTVHVTIQGLSADEASSVKLFLSRENGQGGYSVNLLPPTDASTHPFDWQASYSIPQMHLQAPVGGSYSLQINVTMYDHQSLTTWLPVSIRP